ncbi:hypothetical protein NP233_g3401 [Leucocoprinus birnbaumii]|uniref:RlpA-like protein double-psi beta-barrel domain-containing protein n=1 Tax=Leucocoprinus birnbaumii TaxID=56174 RepID=A0AAD5VWM4_9AGAR|nr:hypothetical protein NP233_g3401 [Leucocoprinus birnbaumii]
MSGVPFSKLGFAVILGLALSVNAAPKSGDVTYYDPRGVMSKTGVGACGVELDKTMKIAALAAAYFDSYPGANPANPNTNPLCGKKVKVMVGGKSTQVTILDRCADCPAAFNIDLAEAAFQELLDPSVGRTQGTWDFINPSDDIGMDSDGGAASGQPNSTQGDTPVPTGTSGQDPPVPPAQPTDGDPPTPTDVQGLPEAPTPTDESRPTQTIGQGFPGATRVPGEEGPAMSTDVGQIPPRAYVPNLTQRHPLRPSAPTKRSTEYIPRRVSRIMRGLLDSGRELGSDEKVSRDYRPKRLSRIMRGVVLERDD